MNKKSLIKPLIALGLLSAITSTNVLAVGGAGHKLHSITFGETAVTVETTGYGCTSEASYAVSTKKSTLTFNLVVEDTCGLAGEVVTMVFDYASYGIDPNKKYVIGNSIVPFSG